MAKKGGLSSNPADAARKAARQRELRKNKADREAAREHALVKKDTSTLEGEIRHLEKNGRAGPELESLKGELKKAREAKDKYLEKHPEHKKFIYPHSQGPKSAEGVVVDNGKGLFRPDGKPRFPERSVYYHPDFNPWGAPPPGLPYAEKSPHEWASSSQIPPQPFLPASPVAVSQGTEDSDDDGDSDGIIMPAGPPPSSALDESEEDNDDDVVMPSGPPPSTLPTLLPPMEAQRVIKAPYGTHSGIPLRYGAPPPIANQSGAYSGSYCAPTVTTILRPPYAPPHSQNPVLPASRPPGYPYARPPPWAPPTGFPMQFRPVNGPLNACVRPRPPPNAPSGPSSLSITSASSLSVPPSLSKSDTLLASATITSAPQLRDLKKEAVTFLPPSVRNKKSKATQKAKMAGLSGVVRANPDVSEEEDEPVVRSAKAAASEAACGQIPGSDAGIPQAHEGKDEGPADERREPEVSLSATPSFVPSIQEMSSLPPQRVRAPPHSTVAAKKAFAKPSLVGYYDSDEEGSDQDETGGPTPTDQANPNDQEREEQQSGILAGSSTSSAVGPSVKGRVNLVETIKKQLPETQSSTKKKDGDGDYERWLQSIGES